MFCHFYKKSITSRLGHWFRGETLKYKENNLMGSRKGGENMRNEPNLDCQIMSGPTIFMFVLYCHIKGTLNNPSITIFYDVV